MRERFYVRSLVGTPIYAKPQLGGATTLSSYYVLDRLVNCRVVATLERRADVLHSSRRELRESAERHAATLNAAWRQELEAA